MKRGPTGQYRSQVIGGEAIQAFIPYPLPPSEPLDLSGPRIKLLEQATLAIGRLDSISLLLPTPDIFLYSYVRREAVLSFQIEGTQSSLSDLLLFELKEVPGVPFNEVEEVSNYVAALEYGLKRLHEGFPLTNRLIREMHGILLSKGRESEKSPVEFRRSQNWIGGTRPGNATFVPAPPDAVEDCMAELEKFFHDKSTAYPALIRAALSHVQFETIHPFLDGNGRIGRLLIAFILHHEGLLQKPLLYLSLYLKQHRAEYYRLLDKVRFEGDWESWLDFFLEGVLQTAQNAVETAQRLVSLFQKDAQNIQSEGRVAGSALRVFQVLCQRPLFTINEGVRQTGLTFPAITNSVKTLLNLGIISEITGRQRNRIFAYDEFLKILSEGTEEL